MNAPGWRCFDGRRPWAHHPDSLHRDTFIENVTIVDYEYSN